MDLFTSGSDGCKVDSFVLGEEQREGEDMNVVQMVSQRDVVRIAELQEMKT